MSAAQRVSIAAFSFDSSKVTDALSTARGRDGKKPLCRLVQDRGYYNGSQFMKNRGPRVAKLRALGVEFRMYTAKRLHQKTLLADNILYIGSGNFTDATLENVERAAIITLDAAAAAEEQRAFDELWESSVV